MSNYQPSRKVSDEFARDCGERLHSALARWENEGELWPKKAREARTVHDNDEFWQALEPIYRADHERLCREVSEQALTALMDYTRACGVRLASVSRQDFVTFENFGDSPGTFGSPIAWRIADRLDHAGGAGRWPNRTNRTPFGGGAGNGPQKQISNVRIMKSGSWGFPAIGERYWGCYDLREGRMERVCDPLTLSSMIGEEVRREYDDGDDLLAYFFRCGAPVPGYRKVSGGHFEIVKNRRRWVHAVVEPHPELTTEHA
jgi:hypothetical protein